MSRCLMWKKEDSKPAGVSGDPVNSATRSSLAASSSPATVGALPTSPRAAACISQGIRIKGEITGSEDLFVDGIDRKSTRLNSSHSQISYAVFCLKKKKQRTKQSR